MNAKEAKTQNAANSKNLVNVEINDTMSVRIYSKSRAKGEVKFKKKRDSITFKNAEAANTHINAMVDAGAKIRKVEVINADGTFETMKPTKVRITPTKEEKAQLKATRQAEREAKAAAKAEAKAQAKAEREAAKAEKAKAKAEAKTKEVKTEPKAKAAKKNVAEEALA